MDWYLLRTKPREEWRAKQHLENQSFTTYLPVLTRRQGNREPLFPGYIFLAEPAEELTLHTIRSTRGVMNFVRFGMEFAVATADLVREIKAIEAINQGVSQFKAGQKVECKSGPFAGIEAIFKMENGIDRCVILLKILNAEREIVVDQNNLKVI